MALFPPKGGTCSPLQAISPAAYSAGALARSGRFLLGDSPSLSFPGKRESRLLCAASVLFPGSRLCGDDPKAPSPRRACVRRPSPTGGIGDLGPRFVGMTMAPSF